MAKGKKTKPEEEVEEVKEDSKTKSNFLTLRATVKVPDNWNAEDTAAIEEEVTVQIKACIVKLKKDLNGIHGNIDLEFSIG